MSANETSVAVLIACRNRAEKTLRCLSALFAQERGDMRLDVFLVDDGSSDGTPRRVSRAFPTVRILTGDGTLFWGGGMALAQRTALAAGHDLHLWLNDDTFLDAGALKRLLATERQLREALGSPPIVVGATRDPAAGSLTSSGVRQRRLRPLNFVEMPPSEQPLPCDTFQGNCVLMAREIAVAVGPIDPVFRHYIGDIDYGLRARAAGYSTWLAPGFAGSCRKDSREGVAPRGWRGLVRALAALREPKGLLLRDGPIYSFRQWSTFAARHGGPLWLLFFVLPYRRLVRCLIPSIARL